MVMALALTLCLTMFIVATQLETVTELGVSKTERDYERALEMAEAGANAYLSRLSFGAADSSPNKALLPPLYQYPNGAGPTTQQFRAGVLNGTYTLVRYPAGSQQGYFAGTVSSSGGTVRIASFGWSNGIVRRVISVAPGEIAPEGTEDEAEGEAPGEFTFFVVTSMTAQNNISLYGTLGTTGQVTAKNNFWANAIVLYGPEVPYPDLSNNASVGSITRTTAIEWPTVAEVALKKFPNGGLAYLRSNNDNSMATVDGTHLSGTVIDAENNVTVRFFGKPGGANYYLTSVDLKNNADVIFDTTSGPITIWFGPTAAGDYSGGWYAKNNCTLTMTKSGDATKDHVAFYIGTKGGFTGKNNLSCAIGIYAHNEWYNDPVRNADDNVLDIELMNNAMVSGTFVADKIGVKNNMTVNPSGPYFTLSGVYGVEDWTE